MNNIKQLEYLFRVHVMISVVHNGGSGECLQHLLAALGYVMLIWKVTLQKIIVSCVVSYLHQNLYTIMACGSVSHHWVF